MHVRSPQLKLPAPKLVGALDQAVDDFFEWHLRNRSPVDRLMYTASAVGDHGMMWMFIGAVKAAQSRAGGWEREFFRLGLGLGAESILVNGPVKWLFRRERPVQEQPRPLRLRQPRTSSFPSGHASAGFFAAALLRGSDPLWPLYYAFAVVVAASRVHVRIHHASDVIGGALVGTLLGELLRAWIPLPDGTRGGIARRRGR